MARATRNREVRAFRGLARPVVPGIRGHRKGEGAACQRRQGTGRGCYDRTAAGLALADSLQEVTGVPVAPVFWAATDDTDFKEASSTVIAVTGGAQLLRIEHTEVLGRPMASMPLGDVSAQLDALVRAAG
jgi:hypothetical protein